MSTDYDLDGFTVTTFYGGKERGQCLQINVGDQFVVLPWAQAARLSYWLNESSWLRGQGDAVSEAKADVGVQDQARERLLARMAGNIVAGWDLRTMDLEHVAKKALQIAEQILKQIESRK